MGIHTDRADRYLGDESVPVPPARPRLGLHLIIGVGWGLTTYLLVALIYAALGEDRWSLAELAFWVIFGGVSFGLVTFWLAKRKWDRCSIHEPDGGCP